MKVLPLSSALRNSPQVILPTSTSLVSANAGAAMIMAAEAHTAAAILFIFILFFLYECLTLMRFVTDRSAARGCCALNLHGKA